LFKKKTHQLHELKKKLTGVKNVSLKLYNS